MSIKSNENTVGMHVSAITGAIGNLRNAGRIKGTDKGRTNYPEYRKAITYNTDMSAAVNDYLDKLKTDCNNLTKLAAQFAEFDCKVQNKMLTPSTYIPGGNRKR